MIPGAPVFRFSKRAVVHFAADTDEIHMTTQLAKNDTKFLPFNRGSAPGDVACGAGNPQHLSGYPHRIFLAGSAGTHQFSEHFGFVRVHRETVKRKSTTVPVAEQWNVKRWCFLATTNSTL